MLAFEPRTCSEGGGVVSRVTSSSSAALRLPGEPLEGMTQAGRFIKHSGGLGRGSGPIMLRGHTTIKLCYVIEYFAKSNIQKCVSEATGSTAPPA